MLPRGPRAIGVSGELGHKVGRADNIVVAEDGPDILIVLCEAVGPVDEKRRPHIFDVTKQHGRGDVAQLRGILNSGICGSSRSPSAPRSRTGAAYDRGGTWPEEARRAACLLSGEEQDGRGATDPRSSTLGALQRAFEKAGVVFLEPGDIRDGGAGVRLKKCAVASAESS
jgi:hypothetical protein